MKKRKIVIAAAALLVTVMTACRWRILRGGSYTYFICAYYLAFPIAAFICASGVYRESWRVRLRYLIYVVILGIIMSWTEKSEWYPAALFGIILGTVGAVTGLGFFTVLREVKEDFRNRISRAKKVLRKIYAEIKLVLQFL